jgi:hypothetical protein
MVQFLGLNGNDEQASYRLWQTPEIPQCGK